MGSKYRQVKKSGAGFRFLYAAFLQEASNLYGCVDDLDRLSQEMTSIGDSWRSFAVSSSRIVKQRGQSGDAFEGVSELMLTCAARKGELYKNLQKVVGKLKA